MEQATKKKVIVGSVIAAIVLIVGGVILYLWWRKRGSSTDNKTRPPDNGDTDDDKKKLDDKLADLVDKGKEKLGEGWDISIEAKKKKAADAADPLAPATTPTPGKYYAVKDGDSDALIIAKAGFPTAQRYAARKAMRDHAANEWIGTTVIVESAGKQLRLFRRFAPMVGKEGLAFAHLTAWQSKTGATTKYPVVYVPTLGEVEA